jgi:T-complex protein 1 subunit eta
MEISKYLRDTSRTIEGKQQLIISAFAKALEVIPRQICDNAGIDATDVLNKLRMLHARGERWAGVDVENDGVADNMEKFVWEPALVKINALEGAAEAACVVLSVDETVTNPSSQVSRCYWFSFSPRSSSLLIPFHRRSLSLLGVVSLSPRRSLRSDLRRTTLTSALHHQ